MKKNWEASCASHPGGDGALVLIIDDEESLVESLAFILSDRGFRVEGAVGGLAGIDKLRGGGYEVILLDLSMPDIDGLSVLDFINGQEVDSSVVVVSGTTSVDEATTAMRRGASDFITKPYRPEEVLRSVESVCKSRRLKMANKAMQRQLAESEQFHRLVVKHSPDLIFTLDVDGTFIFINDRIHELTGWSTEEVLGKRLTELLPMEEHATAFDLIKHAGFHSGVLRKAELHLLRKTDDADRVGRRFDDTVPVDLSLVGAVVDSGQFKNSKTHCCGIFGSARDLTERMSSELKLRRISAQLQHITSASPAVLYSRDPGRQHATFVSGNIMELLGYNPSELLINDANLFALVHPDDRRVLYDAETRLPQDRQHNVEYRMRHRDGRWRWVRDTARLLLDNKGHPLEVVGSWVDNTEAHFLSEQLAHQASHDALTGLSNRRAFEARLGRALESAKATKIQHALCYLDLDQFKVVNDTCGHAAGDSLLRELGQILVAKIRSSDLLARLGGDEFGLLMENCRLDDACKVAESLCRTIGEYRFAWAERSFMLGVSIGLVPINEHTKGMSDALSFADSACYAAKDAGRNRVQVFEHNDEEAARRHSEMEWVASIHRALEEERFFLAAQAITPVDSSAEDGGNHYELLLRLKDPDGNLIMPSNFLPAAERYHLASRLDQWVVHHAFNWLSNNPGFMDGLRLCTINLSGHSMGDPNLLAFIVQEVMKRPGIAKKICFEVTETAAIANLGHAVTFIKSLKEMGVRFALDDFGSGTSSFGYLKTLPVDYLKIDGMFVESMGTDPISQAMVRSINDVGKAMGMQTIAEFVDSEDTLNQLREIGVDYAQGYWIAEPRPLYELC